ncbi:MAG TPA: membrane protein insertion efficiency factor YidD [Solirubrobacteraceae bacterium]
MSTFAPPGAASSEEPPEPQWMRRLAREAVVAPMVVWNRFVAPALPPRCKYEPSCSRYSIEAVREFGIIKGLVLAGWRLLRCNPWSHGGFDPVADQRVFGPRSA